MPKICSDFLKISRIQTDRRSEIKQFFRRCATTFMVKPYVHQCCLGNWNKFPSCQHEFLISHINDETETVYKRDRSSDPLTAPRRLSHTLSLQHQKLDNVLFPEFYSQVCYNTIHFNLMLEYNY